ncbi:MAG: geranylgeranyl reductase family protein [Acidimicrobiales bacterium]
MSDAVDLLVIGAGPAGAAAAITGARAGRRVTVIDKATFPRPKCCGDGLTTGCLRHLDELGLDPTTIPSWKTVTDVHLVGPDGKLRVFPLPRNAGQFAAVARRTELDAALVELARSAGATVYEDCAIAALRQRSDYVEVDIAGAGAPTATLTARWVLAADGMWSPTRKLLGHDLGGYRGDWHAFRQYFTNVSEQAQNQLICWFEPDILPGYVWSFPVGDGSANVGFGVPRGGPVSTKEMRALWPDLLARPHIAAFLGTDAQPEDRHTAWPIPARLGELPLSDGRVLFIGDAAAATDPMSGEGIGQALETGRLAAELVTSADVDTAPRSIASAYEKALARGMQRDHALAGQLTKVLANERAATLSLAAAGLTGWTRRNFARWLFEDYPRAVLGTPKRWSRDVFRRPGAFR